MFKYSVVTKHWFSYTFRICSDDISPLVNIHSHIIQSQSYIETKTVISE